MEGSASWFRIENNKGKQKKESSLECKGDRGNRNHKASEVLGKGEISLLQWRYCFMVSVPMLKDLRRRDGLCSGCLACYEKNTCVKHAG